MEFQLNSTPKHLQYSGGVFNHLDNFEYLKKLLNHILSRLNFSKGVRFKQNFKLTQSFNSVFQLSLYNRIVGYCVQRSWLRQIAGVGTRSYRLCCFITWSLKHHFLFECPLFALNRCCAQFD